MINCENFLKNLYHHSCTLFQLLPFRWFQNSFHLHKLIFLHDKRLYNHYSLAQYLGEMFFPMELIFTSECFIKYLRQVLNPMLISVFILRLVAFILKAKESYINHAQIKYISQCGNKKNCCWWLSEGVHLDDQKIYFQFMWPWWYYYYV